jgi:hypothetical protein
MSGELERRGHRRPARFSRTTLGVGIAIGVGAALLLNVVVGIILGLVKMAIIATVVVVIAYFVIVGPPWWKDDKRR